MPYAILSVSDKVGVADLAGELHERGWTLLSTGGTAQTIREASVPVTGIAEHTGFPEILGGRGGGSGTLFQGKATRLERREEAAEVVRG